MKKLNIKYRGPIKGRLRVFFHKKDIQKRFSRMVWLAASCINMYELFDGVNERDLHMICKSATEVEANPYKMYVFMENDGLHFGFFDCGIEDHGEFMVA